MMIVLGKKLSQHQRKKKQKKRNKEHGYSAENVPGIIERMKNLEAGKWRTFNKLEMSYTIITRDWAYEGKKYRKCLLSP